MEQDKLREERTQSPFDRLVSYGTAALGIGAGAAVFSKNGGLKKIADASAIIKRATNDLTDDFARTDWSNFTTKEAGSLYKKIFKDPTRGLKEAKAFVKSDDYKASLRTDGSRGAFSVFRQINDTLAGLRGMQKRHYDMENIIKPVANKYNDLYKFERDEDKRRLENLVQTMNDRSTNKMAIYAKADSTGIANMLGGKKEIDRIFEELKAVKAQKDEEFVFNKEFDEKIRKDITEKAYDINSLEKTLGSKNIKNKLGETNKDYVTIGEFLEQYNDQFEKSMVNLRQEGQSLPISVDAKSFLLEIQARFKKQGDAELERFNSLYLDRGMYRKDKNGKIYSLKEAADLSARPIEEFGATMPGKIAKIFDIKKMREQPVIHEFAAGPMFRDGVLADTLGRTNSAIAKNYLRVHDKTYEIGKDSLDHIEELDRAYLISRKNGTMNTLMRDMMGEQGYRRTDSVLKNWLDIGKTPGMTFADMPGNIAAFQKSNNNPRHAISELMRVDQKELDALKEAKFRFSELDRTIPEMARSGANDMFVDSMYAVRDEALDTITGRVDQARTVYRFYSQNAKASSRDAAARLLNHQDTPEEAKEVLEMLKMSDSELLQHLAQNPKKFTSNVRNDNLPAIAKRYLNNPKSASDSVTIKNAGDMTGKIFGNENRSSRYIDDLRLELEKEMHMSLSVGMKREDGTIDLGAISNLIEDIGGSEVQKRNLQFNSDFSLFQMSTGVYKDATDGKSIEQSADMAERVMQLFASRKNDPERNDIGVRLVEEVHNKTKRFSTSYDLHMQDENIVEPMNNANWGLINKAISPLDLINNLNDETIRKGFFKQFTAGRNNMKDVTTATMLPYFFLNRLNDPLDKISLALSSKYTGSSVDLMRGIVATRALPIAVGITGYQYLDDMQKATTGRGITESFLINAAHVDLGVRGAADALGMSEWLKSERQVNPIAQYMFGDDYMDYDERKDYYQNGYTQMRKGRWWSFGSLNEFRGSQVQYWQPNMLRRVTSDYKDKALYNGFLDKWSHSLMPTPTDPLSPIRAIMDPYWLENRFSEDRPYPITGKMFTEETPWGPLLNATIGQVVKPQKLMHQDRLGSNMVDSRAIIERRNQEIMERANGDNRHLARVKDGAIEAVNFTSFDAPTESQRILRGNGGGSPSGINYGAFSGVTSAEDYMSEKVAFDDSQPGDGFGGGFGQVISGMGSALVRHDSPTALLDQRASSEGILSNLFGAVSASGGGLPSFGARMEMDGANGNIISGALSTLFGPSSNGSLGIIENMNYNTLMSTRSYRPDNSHVKERGVVTSQSIYKAGARFGDGVMDNEQALSDLRGLSNTDDMIGELAYSARFITGIYGYGTFLGIGGQAKNKLSDASDMTTPIRSFWDANLGGVGGNYFEIFRRFIPSNNFLENNFNPLMNTMPDWMPDKYRFGDSMAALPKGEMRMPGRGYEALNELHPDQYGRYGSFDRYKILADISPGSEEYKVWRDIAKDTVRDPELKRQMDQIDTRVKKQNEKYDFFDYRFLGQGTDRSRVAISEVIDNNTFKVVGDDRTFKLAGVNVTNENKKDPNAQLDEGVNALGQYLAPGEMVTLATDKNQYNAVDEMSGAINAAVFVGGESVSKKLLKDGFAERRADMSAAGTEALYSGSQILRGKAFEAIAHLPIPLYQQKFMKIRDPLESYKQEMVYGTNYTSWNRPIDSILKPAFERSLMSDTEFFIGAGAAVANFYAHRYSDMKEIKQASNVLMALTNRGAFIGGFLGKGVGLSTNQTRAAAFVGAAAQMVGYAYTRDNQPIQEGLLGASIGAGVGHFFKNIGMKKGTAVGAAIGFLGAGMSSSALSDDDLGFGNKYIPKRTRENWEMTEYYDRLEYVKYSGMFNKAARLAKRKEGVNVKKLVEDYDAQREENRKANEQLSKYREIVVRAYAADSKRKDQLLNEIDSKMNVLKESEFNLAVGDYGKSALIYKQAMDSTIYGLKEDANWSQIVRATPTNERDHFMAFMKIADPKKRKEILKVVSPYEAKILKTAWGEKQDKQESNDSYFMRHKMPNAAWEGWRPDKKLSDIQVKTIANEGRLLSDFGYYESQLRDPEVIHAKQASANDPSNGLIHTQLAITAALKGYGLLGVNVNVEPKKESGLDVAMNFAKVAKYDFGAAVSSFL